MKIFSKMRGTTTSPPRVGAVEIVWSWIGAFIGITAVAYLNFSMVEGTDQVLLIGSFGASAVLMYGAIKSPLAQPRNMVGGHILSALIGVASYKIFHEVPWLACSMAVATALAVMHATKTLHPPAGATALIAVIGGPKIHALGFLYAIMPVGVGILIMLVIALVINNVARNRKYPEFWF
jgi:CBS-domain-containing membrane protein